MQDTQFVIRTLASELCEAFADGKEEKTVVGFPHFAVRPPDGFSLLKIRSCFTFNHRGIVHKIILSSEIFGRFWQRTFFCYLAVTCRCFR